MYFTIIIISLSLDELIKKRKFLQKNVLYKCDPFGLHEIQ